MNSFHIVWLIFQVAGLYFKVAQGADSGLLSSQRGRQICRYRVKGEKRKTMQTERGKSAAWSFRLGLHFSAESGKIVLM